MTSTPAAWAVSISENELTAALSMESAWMTAMRLPVWRACSLTCVPVTTTWSSVICDWAITKSTVAVLLVGMVTVRVKLPYPIRVTRTWAGPLATPAMVKCPWSFVSAPRVVPTIMT